MKSLLKQVVPPILIPMGRTVLGRNRALPEDPQQAALRGQHERRNRDTVGAAIQMRDGLTLKLHPESRDAFEHFCFRAPEMVEELDAFLRLTQDRQRLLDVGALHGLFSLVFAVSHPEKTALAIDASPLAFARLLYNVHKNQLSTITPVECAVSDVAGQLQMHYEWEHAVAAPGLETDPTLLTVEKRTGDAVCAEYAFAPDVIKIDVEGHEVKVLRGLRETISRCKPLLFLELHPARIAHEQDSVAELVAFFTDFGYQAALVEGHAVALTHLADFTGDQRLILTPA